MSRLFGNFGSMGAVFFKGSCRGKFAQLVADHIFRDENRVKDFAVVNEESVSHEVWGDHGPSRPGFDRFFNSGLTHLLDLFEKMKFDKGTFFK